ncbi:MAG TPA: hypothetical protein VIC57_18025 [Candidatus Dormibacteraeota bacterium]
MLRADPTREHLDVAAAASMFDAIPPRPGSPVWTDEVRAARSTWRRRAGELAPVAPAPVHADPHAWNHVVEGGRPYVVDWNEIDLSDPRRDAGVRLWWHVPAGRWPGFVAALGGRPDRSLRTRILWWAAFKALRNAFWIDARGDRPGAAASARGFVAAVAALSGRRDG